MAINATSVASPKTENYKIWKSTPTSDSAILLTPDTVMMVGNQSNFVAVSPVGVSLTGNVTLNCLSEQRRQGGLFISMNDFVRMIPPTIVTPLPPQIPFPPIALPLAMLAGTAFFVAMLA